MLEVSRRLLKLHQLLGAGDSETDSLNSSSFDRSGSRSGNGSPSVSASELVWMVTREPGLMTADFRRVARRLLEMKVQGESAFVAFYPNK